MGKSSVEPRAILMKVSLGKMRVAPGRPEIQVHHLWQIGKPTKPLTSLSGFGVRCACEVAGTILLTCRCQQRSVPAASSAGLKATTRSQCFSRKTAIRVR